MASKKITINRAPVLVLWGAVVAERLGYDRGTALTIGKAVADLDAEAKGRRLGIIDEPSEEEQEAEREAEEKADEKSARVLGRRIPLVKTPQAVLRAEVEGKLLSAEQVEIYLGERFKDDLDAVRGAMEDLAKAYDPKDLERKAYGLYEKFRPEIPEGKKGWGAKGELDLDAIRKLAK